MLQFQYDNAKMTRPAKVLEHQGRPNRNRSSEDRVMAPKQIRPIRVEGNVAYVPLTKGYEAVIDAEDVPLVEGWCWRASIEDGIVYAKRTHNVNGKRINVRMHRLLMGSPQGLEIDHRDGNGLNNRRSNLRVATSSQNKQNQGIRADNTSGFKGVTWVKRDRKWQARIEVGGKRRFLGLFKTPEAAHAAYVAANAELHGSFGRVE